MCGAAKDAGVKGVDLANVEYVLINNLGVVTGKSLGLSQSASLAIGSAFSHFAGIADVLSGNAAAFLMVYSLIKSFIEGCDPRLLPKKLVELNKHGMPERSMWLQAINHLIYFIWWQCNESILHDLDGYDERIFICTIFVLDRCLSFL